MHICPVCGKHYTQRGSMKSHLVVHTGEKPFVCDTCYRAFNDKSAFRNHVRLHTGEKPYTCNVCQKSFTQKITLKRHSITHLKPPDPFRRLTVRPGEKPYACDSCDRDFNDRTALRVHRTIHTGEKPYKCDICPKSFRLNSQLRNHVLVHSKPYKCSICPKEYAQEPSLQRHLKRHARKKRYCEFCEQDFPTEKELKIHQRVCKHIVQEDEVFVKKKYKKSPIKCSICRKVFQHEIHLKTHMLLHISNPDFFCQQCGTLCDGNEEYETHLKIHNDVTITFICEFCRAEFPTMEELKTHESKHKESNDMEELKPHESKHKASNDMGELKKHESIHKASNDMGELKTHESKHKASNDMGELKKHESIHKVSNEIVINMPDTAIVGDSNVNNIEMETSLMCDKCGGIFYKNHDHLCHFSADEFVDDPQENSDSEDDAIRLCEICGGIFDSKLLFSDHLPCPMPQTSSEK